MTQSDNRVMKHRAINLVAITTLSMFLTCLFHPISEIGFFQWLIKSLQVMSGMLVFTFYGFVEGYIGEAFPIILTGLGVPVLLYVVHVWKKSLAALYIGTFFWILAGWASVIAAPM